MSRFRVSPIRLRTYYNGKKELDFAVCTKATRRQRKRYRKPRRKPRPHQHLRRREEITTRIENNERERYEKCTTSGRTGERITGERR